MKMNSYLLQLIAVAAIVYLYECFGIQDLDYNFPDEANILGQNLYENKQVSQFTDAQRRAIVHQHNYYRSLVQPEASNMKFMEWHDEAAMLAQSWASKCTFEHGFPQNHPLSAQLGQNMYLGSSSDGILPAKLWFEEQLNYHINNMTCDPKKKCGHYTQMVWAESKFVGCGIQNCSPKGNIIVCNYLPKGNYKGRTPYKIGRPCSECATDPSDTVCYNSSCASKEQCGRLGLECNATESPHWNLRSAVNVQPIDVQNRKAALNTTTPAPKSHSTSTPKNNSISTPKSNSTSALVHNSTVVSKSEPTTTQGPKLVIKDQNPFFPRPETNGADSNGPSSIGLLCITVTVVMVSKLN